MKAHKVGTRIRSFSLQVVGVCRVVCDGFYPVPSIDHASTFLEVLPTATVRSQCHADVCIYATVYPRM